MKRLGVIGGVSPESTVIYYRLLNKAARARFGGEHSANIVLYTLDYGVMIRHYDNRDWPAFIDEVVSGAETLAAAGADALVISSNTTHVAADAIAQATGLPVIHMLDVLSDAMKAANVRKPLLTGTPVVMGGDHYRPALAERYDGNVLVPDEDEQAEIGRIILDELVNGVVTDASHASYLGVIDRWRGKGADGVILGCTELCMILDQSHTDLPVFDTTALHAAAAARFAFGDA
jgi:aspartate racemase